uniref:C2H2-type domain-containing protein n=1 Tax=Mola mola TaxID=94237 RepID=A0A3Q4BEV2_MOLML
MVKVTSTASGLVLHVCRWLHGCFRVCVQSFHFPSIVFCTSVPLKECTSLLTHPPRPPLSTGPLLLSDAESVREEEEEEEEEEEVEVGMGCLIPSEVLLPEDNSQVDPNSSPLRDQVSDGLSGWTNGPSSCTSRYCVFSHLHQLFWRRLGGGVLYIPLVIQPDTRNIVSGEKVNFVCPLILKPESQQACVSTETKSNLHMKLKLTALDLKLVRPCKVQLVDMLKAPEPEMQLQNDVAKCSPGWPLPKDLRRHRGPHTGHRLCCFSACGNGVWRLKKVVTHTRDGYVCNICEKTFKRRKILRRHERFHTGEKPYSCTVCSKTFALRKSLRRHTRFHTDERPHTCSRCSKRFRLRENLKAHLRFHTGEKPFSCTTCGKMFRIMRNLEKHQCAVFVPSFRTIAGF